MVCCAIDAYGGPAPAGEQGAGTRVDLPYGELRRGGPNLLRVGRERKDNKEKAP